jgi:hypothetical protein
MWFINFALAAGVAIVLLLYGWVSYLEGSAAAQSRTSGPAASVPLPRPKPEILRAPERAQASVAEMETVREPKTVESSSKRKRKQKRSSARPTW